MWDHELTGDNVYIDAKTGNRRCRACNARRQRKLHAKRFAAGAMPPPDAHCKYGHPYEVDPQGRWFCHTCRNRRQREWKARKRGQEQG